MFAHTNEDYNGTKESGFRQKELSLTTHGRALGRGTGMGGSGERVQTSQARDVLIGPGQQSTCGVSTD